MCNLYSETKGQAAIRALFRTTHDRTGNLPAFPGIFPDQLAPIVRNSADGACELVMARWGMPGPLQFGGRRSPTSATSQARIGAAGFQRGTAASCQRPRSANTPRPLPARPRHGSHWVKIGRCL
jgi:putative SOS response-associated peptidase YedK